MKLCEIKDLFPKEEQFGEKVLFRNGLETWRQQQGQPFHSIRSATTESVISRIQEWISNLDSPSTSTISNDSKCNEAIDVVNVLKSTVRGKMVLNDYKENKFLSGQSQKDLVHCIVEYFLLQKRRMTYEDMDRCSVKINQLFPNEKKEIYFMRSVKYKNSVGKLYSRWCNTKRLKRILKENTSQMMEIKFLNSYLG